MVFLNVWGPLISKLSCQDMFSLAPHGSEVAKVVGHAAMDKVVCLKAAHSSPHSGEIKTKNCFLLCLVVNL